MKKRRISICLCLVVALLLCGCRSTDYEKAVSLFESGKYDEAETAFSALNDYKDSADYLADIPYQKALLLFKSAQYDLARDAFSALADYKDSADYVKQCNYELAKALFEAKDYDAAEEAFSALSGYADAADYLADIPYQRAQQLLAQGDYAAAERAFALLDDYKDSKKMVKETKYQAGLSALEAQDFDTAERLFEELGDYRDSAYMINDVRNTRTYTQAEQALSDGQYDEAIALFQSLGSFEDSSVRAVEALEAKNDSIYSEAEELLAEKNYDAAVECFLSLGDYRDSADRANQAVETKCEEGYAAAEALLAEEEYYAALAAFEALGDYRDSLERVEKIKDTIVQSFHVEDIRITRYEYDEEGAWSNYECYNAILETDVQTPFIAIVVHLNEQGEQIGHDVVPMIDGEGTIAIYVDTEVETGPESKLQIIGYIAGIEADPNDYSIALDEDRSEYDDWDFDNTTSCHAYWNIKSSEEATGILLCSVVIPETNESYISTLILADGEGELYDYISDLPYEERDFAYEIKPLLFCKVIPINMDDCTVLEPYHVNVENYTNFNFYCGTISYELSGVPDSIVISTRQQTASPSTQGVDSRVYTEGSILEDGVFPISVYDSVDTEYISSDESLPEYIFNVEGYLPWQAYDDPISGEYYIYSAFDENGYFITPDSFPNSEYKLFLFQDGTVRTAWESDITWEKDEQNLIIAGIKGEIIADGVIVLHNEYETICLAKLDADLSVIPNPVGNNTNAPQDRESTKTITVVVVHKDGSKKEYTITTTSDTLRAAMEQENLLQGSSSEYGLFIETVDGETADSANQEWWAITKDGAMVETGVDDIMISDGERYEITLTVGW